MADSAESGKILSFRSAVIIAISIVFISLALLAIIKDKETLLPFSDALLIIGSGVAAIGMLYGAYNSAGRSRNAWTVLAIAQIANTFGDVSWGVIEVGLHQNPFPSLADVWYLMFYPIFALGILLLPTVPLSHRERQKILLDAGIVVVASALIFWVFIIAPIVASSEIFNLDLAVSVVYPVMGLVLFAALVELIFRKLSLPETKSLFLLALGLVTVVIADAIFCIYTQQRSYVSGTLLDAVWLISYMLFWLAGVQQANSKPLSQPINLSAIYKRRSSWTHYSPYLGIGAISFLLVWGYENTRFIDYSLLAGSIGAMVGMMFVREKVTSDQEGGLLQTILSQVEERKNAESTLREQINFLRTLMDTIPNPIFYKDEKGIYQGCNDAFEKAIGIGKEEIIGKTVYDISPKDLADKYAEIDEALLSHPGAQTHETSFQYFDGTRRDIISNGATYSKDDGTVAGIVGVFVDITEHKRAEEALARSEEKYRTLFETMTQGVVYQDAEGRITSANIAAERILGMTFDQMKGRTSMDPGGRAIHEDGSNFPGENHPSRMALRAMAPIGNVIMGIFNPQEQNYRWITINAMPQFKSGDDRPYQVYTIFEDITEQRLAEKALKESEDMYRAIFENTGTATIIVDDSTIITLANSEFERLTGFGRDEIEGKKSWTEFAAKEDLGIMLHRNKSRMINPDAALKSYEFRARDRNGHIRDILLCVDVIPGTKKIVASLLDITERKQAERRLKESEGFLNKIIDSIGDPIFVKNRQHQLVLVNDAACKLFGRSRENLLGCTAYNLFPKREMADISRIRDEAVFETGVENVSEETNTYANDVTLTVLVKKTLYTDDSGNQFLVGVTSDITERKKMEESLRESKERYRILAESSQDMIYVISRDDRIEYVNSSAARSLGQQAEKIAGMLRSSLFPLDVIEHQKLSLDNVFKTGLPARIESMMIFGGREVWQDTHLIPLKTDDNETYSVLGISRDITEHKRSEELLKASLAEKELLLKEVHHRVKNNLQVISALLYLQSLNFTDENIIKVFRDSQDRIKSIALIHESLYKSKSLGKVDFSEYIKQLISQLSQSYGDLKGKVDFNVNAEGVFLNINTAIPCGMIINELISNSLKHAFPDGRSGGIRIDLMSEDDGFKLVVSDDGIGLRDEPNINDSKTLGFQLVGTLVKQIDGRMSLDTSGGTRYEIHFKERK